MRRRRRHVTFGVLLLLFVLPVARPQGFPGFEGWIDGALHWTARLGLTAPRSSASTADGDEGRARDLAVLALEQRETYFQLLDETHQRLELQETVRGPERMPLARAARVLRASDAASARRSLLIDLGSADGIVEGLPVVQGGVFVGTIRRVDAHSSRVQLLTDPYARTFVAIRTLEGARATAWVSGGDGESLALHSLRAADGTRIREGDAVLTGNEDELVPAGLVVGTVSSATDDDADDRLDVRMRALLDPVRTTTVLVLVPPS